MFDSLSANVPETLDPFPAGRKNLWIALGLTAFVFVAFYFSTAGKQQPFDYTYRIAGALLEGKLGLTQPPPSWLNEAVPMDGRYYSVFPLGADLAMMPLALLNKLHVMDQFPGRAVAAVLAAGCAYFFFELSGMTDNSPGRRILLALVPIFGTWTWCNLGFAGAWQIALGFALLGEIAALYFTIVKPRPLMAGAFFALAFGNRTELILTAPIFLYLWFSRGSIGKSRSLRAMRDWFSQNWRIAARFLAVPTALALCTAAYNYARFGSIFDFGYARIPEVMQEPWYQQGLFSIHAIPWNMNKMLLEGFRDLPQFPFFTPPPFGCSIFLASPFLFLLFRERGKFKAISWITIGLLTFSLWCHGNPGGWQFSYRYAMILLPWMFLLLLGNGPSRVSAIELSLFAVSVAINGVATYQFHWTNDIHP